MKQKKNSGIRKMGIALLSALLSTALLSGCTAPTLKNPDESDSISNASETESSTMQQPPAPTPDEASRLGYVIVTDFIPTDGRDVTKALQRLIDENPNRTLYFPDGVYNISEPIKTPANPEKSVSLLLSNYAVIRAMTSWKSDEAMIRLGGKDPDGDTTRNGSNYFLEGGIIDGSGKAKGISVDSGRETAIRNVSIKHTTVGIHIKRGVNNGSSDCDVYNVNIMGNSASDSVGILVNGYDNTFTNIRIGCVNVGVHITSQANVLRNIHPLFQISHDDYENSAGFWDEGGSNWYDFCYSDHFRMGFRLKDGIRSYFNNCFAFWYDDSQWVDDVAASTVEAFHADGVFNSVVRGFRAGFRDDRPCRVLYEEKNGGKGTFEYVDIDDESRLSADDAYSKYVKN